jgi:CheY-like chemotaxis protein
VLEIDRKIRILVVDDDNDSRDRGALLLRLHGHDVAAASSGPAALSLLPRFKPEIILLSLSLTGMSSLELCRRIRRDDKQRHVCIVAVGADSVDQDLHLGEESGFDYHLLLPIDYADLHEIIGTLCF